MTRKQIPLFLMAGIFLHLPATTRAADEPSPTEARLRDALRSTMLQLRDAQTQTATLQEAQAQGDKDKADLQAKVDALTAQLKAATDQATADKATAEKVLADQKQANEDLVTGMVDALSTQINLLNKPNSDDKTPLAKSIADLKSKNLELAKALDQYATDIELWKSGYYQYVQYSSTVEAAREKLAAQVVMLTRLVADREVKNLELYQTGTEILDRYANFSLGDVLTAKEPFVGVSKVKLQELVQDYKDKLLTDKLLIGQPPAPLHNPAVKKADPQQPAKGLEVQNP